MSYLKKPIQTGPSTKEYRDNYDQINWGTPKTHKELDRAAKRILKKFKEGNKSDL